MGFVESAASRETSVELMEAILKVAGGDEKRAEGIWDDGPTSGELACIVEIVTGNGVYDTEDFYWGEMGRNWAEG